MPLPRQFLFPDTQAGIFHCVSRICGRERLMLDSERDALVAFMRAWERFCQVRVLTFCIMENHFHILVHVPRRPDGFDLPLEDVLSLWDAAVGREAREQLHKQFEIYRTNGSERAIEEWRLRMLDRMFSLSEFMKAVKQQFTQWYNAKTGRTGTLWESRYTSVIVEDDDRALRTMATYIDLNPVRAGIVPNPADYRWSGYGEAMAGKRSAREGLERIVFRGTAPAEHPHTAPLEYKALSRRRQLIESLVIYRSFMGELGRELHRADGTRKRRGLSPALSERFRKAGAEAVRVESLLRRVRHLTKGLIFGSRRFVDDWFVENRRRACRGASAEQRKSGARPIGRNTFPDMHTLRQLRQPEGTPS